MNDVSFSTTSDFDRDYAAEQLRRSRQPMRRFVKGLYLREVLRDVRGPCIDFGCGAGQLLERLPPGSIGLEANPHLIESLRSNGLNVQQALAEMRDFELLGFSAGSYRTLVIAHVLEHLPDPAEALRVLFRACRRIGVTRLIAVLPGAKGYASDRTHKTFIDRAYLDAQIPHSCEGFERLSLNYFPGSWEGLGRHFIFHEMKVVFDAA